MRTVLAIDVGTSGTRVSAVTFDGDVIARLQRPPRSSVADERAAVDVESLWADIETLAAQVVGQAGQPVAVGVAGQLGTVLADADLTPIGEVLLWQDQRASSEAVELAGRLEGRDRQLAGRNSTAELTAPRLIWTAKHRPSLWERTRWCLSLKDYVVARLTGEVATDPTSASYSLLFDVRKGAWSHELVVAAEASLDQLPPVLTATQACGTISRAAAAATGLAVGTPVAVGGPDGTVGVLGAGACTAGMAVDIAGTTDVLMVTTDHPVQDPAGRAILNSYLIPGLWTVGGPTGLTGGGVAWLASILGHESVERAYEALDEAIATIGPGASGLSIYPSLTGDRFPTWTGKQAGAIVGIRPGHTSAHLLRAAEEGAAFLVRSGVDALTALDLRIDEIRVSGGLAKSQAALSLRANAVALPMVAASASHATTLGTAVLAAVCAGVYSSVDEAVAAMVRASARVMPDSSTRANYDAAYRRWRTAFPLPDRDRIQR